MLRPCWSLTPFPNSTSEENTLAEGTWGWLAWGRAGIWNQVCLVPTVKVVPSFPNTTQKKNFVTRDGAQRALVEFTASVLSLSEPLTTAWEAITQNWTWMPQGDSTKFKDTASQIPKNRLTVTYNLPIGSDLCIFSLLAHLPVPAATVYLSALYFLHFDLGSNTE